MRRVRLVVVLGILLMAPLAAFALDSPTYKFVEGGYVDIEDNSSSASEDGWFAGVMYGGARWHAFVDYDDVSDISLLFIGGGWHGLLGEKADVVAQISYLDVDAGSGSEDGYRATGGVRWQAMPFLEIAGFLHHTDVVDSDDAFEVRAIGYIDRLGIGVSWETNDIDITKVFVRWSFGK